VFEYLDDPMNDLEWLPGVTETTDVTGSGVGKRHRWKYKMVGVPLSGETVVVEHVPNQRQVIKSSGSTESTWTFIYEPTEDGTMLDLTIDYTIPVPVLGKLAEKLVHGRNEREMDLAMENIRERLET
jgi:carbon monoxide dehydrogenase subunit G